MAKHVADSVIVITGASTGIGRAWPLSLLELMPAL
jgi:NADP-dependent 3-hydroxy acid dehydrogenase YdfG